MRSRVDVRGGEKDAAALTSERAKGGKGFALALVHGELRWLERVLEALAALDLAWTPVCGFRARGPSLTDSMHGIMLGMECGPCSRARRRARPSTRYSRRSERSGTFGLLSSSNL